MAPATARPSGIALSEDGSAVILHFPASSDDEWAVPPVAGAWRPATLTMGEGGRLLDLEVAAGSEGDGGLDIEVSPWLGGTVRQVSVRVQSWRSARGSLARLMIPRRGAGYEITYPSGNQ